MSLLGEPIPLRLRVHEAQRLPSYQIACKPWLAGDRSGTVYAMTTKDRLHQVVDALSEEEAADALDYLVARGRDPLARRLDAAPLDDEPLTDEERESLREAREDFAAGRTVSMDDLRRELLG
jgi:hypothetical protein